MTEEVLLFMQRIQPAGVFLATAEPAAGDSPDSRQIDLGWQLLYDAVRGFSEVDEMRRFVALFGLAFLLFACDSPEERAEQHLERAIGLIASGDDARAAIELRNALRLDDANVPALLAYAAIAERQFEFQIAKEYLGRVAEIEPAHVAARTKLAGFALFEGDIEAAAMHVGAARAAAPDDAGVLAVAAALALRQGDPARAVAEATRALEIEPTLVDATMVLASERVQAGDRAGALAILDRGLARQPDEFGLNLLRLDLLMQHGMAEEVGPQLIRMIALRPDDAGLRIALARWRQSRGEVDLAIGELHDAIVAGGGSELAVALVALVQSAQGDVAAKAELDSLIASAPDPFQLELARAVLNFQTGEEQRALDLLGALAASASDDQRRLRAKSLHASLLLETGDREAARTLIEEILAADPNDVDALKMRAALSIESGEPDSAVIDLRTAISERPDDLSLLQLEAVAYERMGAYELALDRLSSAVLQSGYEPQVVQRYVLLLRQQGRFEAAERVIETAIERRTAPDADLMLALAGLRADRGDWAGVEALAEELRAAPEMQLAADRMLAFTLAMQERYDESIRLLEGLRADGAAGSLSSLHEVYLGAGDTLRAESLVDEALARDPDNVEAILLRGGDLRRRGELSTAEGTFRRARLLDPANDTAVLSLVSLLATQDRLLDAEAEARAALDEGPGRHAVRFVLAGILERRGMFRDAIAEYRVLADQLPGDLMVANNLASLIADHASEDAALMTLAGRLSRRLATSELPQFRDTLGWIQFLNGDTEGALRNLVPAAEDAPDNPWIRYHLGTVLAAVGRREEALDHLEAVIELTRGSFPRIAEIEKQIADFSTP